MIGEMYLKWKRDAFYLTLLNISFKIMTKNNNNDNKKIQTMSDPFLRHSGEKHVSFLVGNPKLISLIIMQIRLVW